MGDTEDDEGREDIGEILYSDDGEEFELTLDGGDDSE